MLENSLENVLKCSNCIEDCYDSKMQECMDLIENNAYSNRISLMTNALIREEEKKKIKRLSNTLTLKNCFSGGRHLYCENSKVLMAHEAYRFVSQVHSDEHLSPFEMLEVVRKYPVYIDNLEQFIK